MIHNVSLDQTSMSVGVVLGLLTVAGLVVGHVKVFLPWWRGLKEQVVAGRDSIVGRPAVIDSITGDELAPALPGVGVRLANVEQNQIETRDALQHIAAVMEGQQVQDRRIERLEDDVSQLKAAALERVVARAESASAWRAVEAVANGHEPDESAELD